MRIIEFERDRVLECRFRWHHFQLERDDDDDYSFGNWYMIVKNDDGEYACDGWIDDSSGYTANRMVGGLGGAGGVEGEAVMACKVPEHLELSSGRHWWYGEKDNEILVDSGYFNTPAQVDTDGWVWVEGRKVDRMVDRIYSEEPVS